MRRSIKVIGAAASHAWRTRRGASWNVRTFASASAGNSMAAAIERAENHGRFIASILDFNSTEHVTAGEIKTGAKMVGGYVDPVQATSIVHELATDASDGMTPEDCAAAMRLNLQPGAARSKEQAAAAFTFAGIAARMGGSGVRGVSFHEHGRFPSTEFTVGYLRSNGPGKAEDRISPWHDIPLQNEDGTFNMICEIPKWTRAKMEIDTKTPFNPVKQDIKKGKLRDYHWGDMMFNYGALPQTYEDPDIEDHRTKHNGDGDPIDVIDIGCRQWPMGAIVRYKPLGVLAMIDDGETDWKVIGIAEEDPLAPMLEDIDDLTQVAGGAAESFREWMRLYKSPDQINQFALREEYQNRAYAEEVIQETHQQWAAYKAKLDAAEGQ